MCGWERRQAISQAVWRAGRTGDLLGCHGIDRLNVTGRPSPIASSSRRRAARRQDPTDPRPLRSDRHLYDWYVCVRGNRVEQVWPITVRGAVY